MAVEEAESREPSLSSDSSKGEDGLVAEAAWATRQPRCNAVVGCLRWVDRVVSRAHSCGWSS